MDYQTVFKRYELKYMITKAQREQLLKQMEMFVYPDKYGKTTVRNIYFDTDTYRLIRRSIEKPKYKEKLRIRSYRKVDKQDDVFVEIKKKYKSVVYKRRIALPENMAMAWVCKDEKLPVQTQITKEIDYFKNYYGSLQPSVFLSYDRQAFYSDYGEDLRITFDENIICRSEEISLGSNIWGKSILDEEKVLMEIKTSGGIPLWLASLLSKEKIYKTSFSKYGTAYQKIIF